MTKINEYAIRAASSADAVAIAEDIREDDANEVWASHHLAPRQGLLKSLEGSRDTRVGTVDGRPVCIFGVGGGPAMPTWGTPWMLSTHEIEKHALVFLRGSRGVMDDWVATYSYLVNFVDARNTLSLRWLKWLGFNIDEAKPHGIEGRDFHRFWFRRKKDV